MFTVCPKCALTLVVTAADLRVAQGYVRCGRCSSVFNALAQLSDERQAAGSAASPSAASPRPSPAPGPPPESPPPARSRGAPPRQASAEEDSIPSDALEFDPSRTDVNSVFVEPAPDPQWTAATGSFKALRELSEETQAAAAAPAPAARTRSGAAAAGPPADAPVDVEIDSALLAGIVHAEQPKPGSRGAPEAASPGAAAAPAPAARPAPRKRASRSAARAVRPKAHPRPATDAAASARQPGESAAQAASAAAAGRAEEAADAVAEEILPAPHPLARLLTRVSPRESAPWASAAAVLVLVLAAQIVNHSRDALATHSRLNGPLTALYSALGVPLAPHWDLHAYDVRQLGAAATFGSGGEITVRASIRNGGRQPQPLPLLRVTLQDRFGTPLASRDVAPRDYLPGAVPASSYLSVDQRIDAEMAFVDPGSRAVGFEIDACLATAGGAIVCANDPDSR